MASISKEFKMAYDIAYEAAWAARDPKDNYAVQSRKAHEKAIEAARRATA